MPLPTWLRFGSPTGSSPTPATSAARLYRQELYRQQAVSTSAAAYRNPIAATTSSSSDLWVTINVPSWSATTSTVTASTVWWSDSQNQSVWLQEGSVDHWQYVALARRRVELTAEQQAAQERAMEAARQERLALELARQQREYQEELLRQQTRADREAALARSRELLLSHLTPAQRETFERNNWFVVEGGATKTRYRIQTRGHTGNIEILHQDDVVARLCGHLRDNLPLYDHHVAQKISLEYDEVAFLRLCNRSAA